MAQVFIYFFQKFPNFCGQRCGVRFRFTRFLPIAVQPTHTFHGLGSCYRRWMNRVSKMKVHWWIYNHCVFVSYLTSVTFGPGWISHTKFLKFSGKDWISIFKKFIRYGSGGRKSTFGHLRW